MDSLLILNHWDADSVTSDYKIGTAEYLFSRIKPERGGEWRKKFSGDETAKIKEEKSALRSKKGASAKAGQTGKGPSKK